MTAGPDPAQPPAPGMSRRALRSGLEILVYFIGGAAVGGGAAYFGLNLLPGVGLLAIGVFFLAMWPNLILHEAGHGLAAMARGMQLVAFGIGPLRLERGSQGRWRLRNGGGVRGMGGFAAAFPRAGREPTRFDEAVVLAGGPLANLVTEAAAAAVQAARATLDRVPDPVGVLLVGEYLDALQARLADGGAVMDGDATASL